MWLSDNIKFIKLHFTPFIDQSYNVKSWCIMAEVKLLTPIIQKK